MHLDFGSRSSDGASDGWGRGRKMERANATNLRVMYVFTSFSAIAQAVSQGPVLDKCAQGKREPAYRAKRSIRKWPQR